MTEHNGQLKSVKIWLLAGIIILLQVAVMCRFGMQKAGMHEDEYYSYYSSNRTNGFFYPDREWVDAGEIRKEFMVIEGEEFQFDLVKTVQSWDVHPPLYYQMLHMACSLTPGIFSKWQGIIVNLIAFALGQVVLAALVKRLAGPGKEGSLAALACLLWWGCTPAAISMVMFIRMYAWLTFWVLCSALGHVVLLQSSLEGSRRMITASAVFLMLVTLAGFLTQYYYIIFLFFAGVFTVAVLGCHKNLRGLLGYIFTQGMALAGAVLYYPSCISHILHGYRGKEAQTAFFQIDNLLQRCKYFYGIIDRLVFGKLLTAVASVIVIFGLLGIGGFAFRKGVRSQENDLQRMSVFFVLFAGAGYFAVVAKTALMLGESSIRYVLPICPVLIAGFVCIAVNGLSEGAPSRVFRAAACGCLIALLACNVYLVLHGSVLFLYPEDKEKTAFARENESVPTIVAFSPAAPYNIWFLTDELLEYDRLFYLDLSNPEPMTDPEICGADRILVYLADHENDEALLERLAAGDADAEGQVRLVDSESMWRLFEIQR